MHLWICIYWLESSSFHFSLTNSSFVSASEISFHYRATHPSKVVCIVEEADATLSDVSYLESDTNRFYFHSGIDYDPLISFSPSVGVESRLFCRITDLGIPETPIYEYVGDPFVIRYTSLSLEYLARQNATVTFNLLPKGLYAYPKPAKPQNESDPASAIVEKGLLQVECKEQPLFTSHYETRRVSIPPAPLPLQFTVLEDPNVNYQLQCSVFSVQPGRPRRALLATPLCVVVAPISSEATVVFCGVCCTNNAMVSTSLQILHGILILQNIVHLPRSLLLLLELSVLLPGFEPLRDLVRLLLRRVVLQRAQIQIMHQRATVRIARHAPATEIVHRVRNETARSF